MQRPSEEAVWPCPVRPDPGYGFNTPTCTDTQLGLLARLPFSLLFCVFIQLLETIKMKWKRQNLK